MSKVIDITGQTFGYWLVLERDNNPSLKGHGAYWIYKCTNCGTIKSVASTKLRKGLTKSCGCVKNPGGIGKKKIDRTGTRIGKLVILRPTEKRTSSREIIWLAKCDCGNICEIRGDDIRNGSKKSCGCSKHNDIKKALQDHTHLEGKRFGKLTVIQRDFESGKWACQCDCGRQTFLKTYELTKENATGSCGHCNYSIGEYKIATLLTEHQIKFET